MTRCTSKLVSFVFLIDSLYTVIQLLVTLHIYSTLEPWPTQEIKHQKKIQTLCTCPQGAPKHLSKRYLQPSANPLRGGDQHLLQILTAETAQA
jgi:hypothetical protein